MMKAYEIEIKMLRGEFSIGRALNEITATFIEIMEYAWGIAERFNSVGDLETEPAFSHLPPETFKNLDWLDHLPGTMDEYFAAEDQGDSKATIAFYRCTIDLDWNWIPPDLTALRRLREKLVELAPPYQKEIQLSHDLGYPVLEARIDHNGPAKIEISRDDSLNQNTFISLRKKIINGEIGQEEATREAQAMLEEIHWNILKKYPGEAAGILQLYDEYIQKVKEYRESLDAEKYQECIETANRYSNLLHRVGYDPVETLALQQMVVNQKTTSTAETKSNEEKIQEDNEMPYFREYEDCLKRYKNGYMITGEISTYIEQVVNDFPAIDSAMLKDKLYDRDGIPLNPKSLSTIISRFKRKKGRE